MIKYELTIGEKRPYFAEVPYYLWGEVNYDTHGNCKNPLDQEWTWMELTNRDTGEFLDITSSESKWTIEGPDPAAARLAFFLVHRCDGSSVHIDLEANLGDWNHEKAMLRSQKVIAMFENKLLEPFAVEHWFWGSWKWVGCFATEFTWVGRWIMDSVVRNDGRAVSLCIDWLREGTVGEPQAKALQHALRELTNLNCLTVEEWLSWYDSEGKSKYPEPNIDEWYEELNTIHKIE